MTDFDGIANPMSGLDVIQMGTATTKPSGAEALMRDVVSGFARLFRPLRA